MNIRCIFLLSVFICSCIYDNQKKANNQSNVSQESSSNLYGDQITSFARINSFDTTVTVLFWDTTDSLSETQKKNLQQFIVKQDSLFPAILNTIFEEYKKGYSSYKKGWTMAGKISDAELEKHLPKPTTRTIGIEFDCTWDIENGLGVMIENWKVAKTGVAEVSPFLP